MKMYASCPICGYKLCKGESGSDVDILCPRCGKLVRVVITKKIRIVHPPMPLKRR